MTAAGDAGFDAELDGMKRTVATVARALHVKDARLEPTLQAVVTVAAATTGFEAGLLLLEEGTLVSSAATTPASHELDELQGKLDDGPCLQAARGQETVALQDTADDDRWPEFCDAARGLSVRSMLCVPLWIDERCLGTLSLYAGRAGAFPSRDQAVAELCAMLAAAALAEARRTEQLRRALEHRDVIGQAKGILMERHKITGDQAFELLSQVSQRRNRKLTVVASHLIETGEILGGL
jgi:GAF domain-containing protein